MADTPEDSGERQIGNLPLNLFPVDAGFPGFSTWPKIKFDALLPEYSGGVGEESDDRVRHLLHLILKFTLIFCVF